MGLFDTKAYLEAIESGVPENIEKMYPDKWEVIMNGLKKDGLIDNWTGDPIANVVLTKKGKAVLSTLRSS